MNPKKKSRRCRASVSIQALDLAISRFIHSLGCVGDQNLQEFNTLSQTRFRTYKIALSP